MKKILKGIGIAILSIILAAVIFVDCAIVYSQNYTVDNQPEKIENSTGLVQASGKSLYDADGNKIVLRGVNAGQILLQEG